ncbi:AAA family ATPase [Candidatus Parcubacteria bacterium]|nr:AAA family ATPase [Candidatus Parcubacteria bacterium]
MQKIIAILGLPGSGKTEVINYLIKKLGLPKVYFGDVTFDELKKRNLEINEKNERMVREDLRKTYGRLYYAEQIIQKIENIKKDANILVESLYDWDEYKLFKEKFADNFMTIAIYSSPETRYKRLSQRSVRPLTLKEAQSRDYAQIENLFQAGPIAMANWTVINENGLEELHQQIDKIIKV